MKRKHMHLKGGGLILLLVLIFTFSLSSSVFAISDGARVQYDSYWTYYTGDGQYVSNDKFWLEGDDSFTGTCHEFGAPETGSGYATAYKKANASDIAKAMYYFGVVKGWGEYVGSNTSQGYAMESISQYLSGTLDPIVFNPSQWSDTFVFQATGAYNTAKRAFEANPEWSSVQIPSWFECYVVIPDSSSHQNFVIWKNKPETGTLKLLKTSSNPAITG